MFSLKNKRTLATAATFTLFLILVCSGSLPPRNTAKAQQSGGPFAHEVNESEIADFVRRHSASADDKAQAQAQDFRQVRIVYLVPSDKVAREDYRGAIGNAVLGLQHFYQQQLGGGFTFSTHAPLVEVRGLSRTSAFYHSLTGPNAFFSTVLGDGFDASGGRFNDPNFRWAYYIDADEACGQAVGTASGVALRPANDLRGLVGEPRVPPCGGGSDGFGYDRWVGGLGHELGHAFGLPHPPGCDNGSCVGGDFARRSLMYQGYALYPNTYLLQENKSALLNTVFFTSFNLSDESEFFVRQHYVDFLNREPDVSGREFWTGSIESCGADAQCRQVKRVDTSAAFFLSIEFQETGFLAYRTWGVAFGTTRVDSQRPLTRAEFLPDATRLGRNVIVGQGAWQAQLEANKQAYFNEFVTRAAFTGAYPSGMTAAQFVDALNANAGFTLSGAERDQLVFELSTGAKSRAQVLRAVAENGAFTATQNNPGFVTMEYFGYLRRDPDPPGFNNWLSKLNSFNGDYRAAEMVRAFIESLEYRSRFGQ
jgi:hypothetical protein